MFHEREDRMSIQIARPHPDPTPEQCDGLAAYWGAIAVIPNQHPATAAFAQREHSHWRDVAAEIRKARARRVSGALEHCDNCGQLCNRLHIEVSCNAHQPGEKHRWNFCRLFCLQSWADAETLRRPALNGVHGLTVEEVLALEPETERTQDFVDVLTV